ncbi:MAG: response regulator [Patescibacteria group bacterium]|nr:response regulator [Patescibacteria group bacterium]
MLKKILIVEDEAALLYALKAELSHNEFEVIEAIDGEKGLQALEDHRPDVVILDLLLPGIDGFEVLRRIKSKPETKNIPVIILTNLGDKESVEKGKSLGADDYLIKTDYSLEEVMKKLKGLVTKTKK